jgi:hypothetical protein
MNQNKRPRSSTLAGQLLEKLERGSQTAMPNKVEELLLEEIQIRQRRLKPSIWKSEKSLV